MEWMLLICVIIDIVQIQCWLGIVMDVGLVNYIDEQIYEQPL